MAEVLPQDVLLRVGGRTLYRTGYLAAMGAGRGWVEVKETFTRADGATPLATFVDRDTTLRKAAADKVRIEYPPALSGLVDQFGYPYCGPSLEGSRTNDGTKSRKFDDGAWGKANASITPNATAGIDGTVVADKLVEDGTNSVHELSRLSPALTNNTRSCFYAHFAPAGRSWVRLRSRDKANVNRDTWFNLTTGVVGTKDGGHDAWITKLANGFYRCAVGFDSATGATGPAWHFFPATGDGVTSYAGDGVSGLYVDAAQFEVDKAFPSSFIETDAAAVTRAADSFTLPFNFGPFSTTVLVRFARTLWADMATGSIGNFPGLFQLGFANQPLFDAYGRIPLSQHIEGRLSAAAGSFVDAAIPAGNEMKVCLQYRTPTTGGVVAEDTGSGFVVGNTATAFSSFGTQVLRVGGRTGDDVLYGVLLDLIFVRGLRTLNEMLAIP